MAVTERTAGKRGAGPRLIESTGERGAESTSVGPKRPEYVVLFRERSERNTALIADTLGVREMRGTSVRATRTVMNSRTESEARPRVYDTLRIATLDLTPDDKRRIERDPAVAMVVRNEVRRIPPIYEEPDEGTSAAFDYAAAPSAPSLPLGATMTSPALIETLRQIDPLTAYLHGLRDAAGLAIRVAELQRRQPALENLRPARAPLTDTEHSWCLSLIGLQPGYARATGKGVRVAVLDTGIDLTHPDFQGRFAGGNDTESFIRDESVQDGNGHGTHCAGVIGAKVDSAGGRRYCVAPDVDLAVGKVLSNDGFGNDDSILDAIDWAANTAQARIISMSLGSARRAGGAYAEAYEVVAESLLENGQGTIIIAASGNESARPSFVAPVGNPAACPSIAAVAAVDRNKFIAPYSCGQVDTVGAIEYSAPGSAVYSAWTGGGYKTISGTSMATPHVAAVAALVLEAFPKATAKELWQRLTQLCVTLGDARTYGAGLIQVP
ncbi:MAG TPA: S8 family serine peptidase [Tepidisphaeraceae bacterium]